MNIEQEINLAICRAGGQKVVAQMLGISVPCVSRKVAGQRGWNVHELQVLLEKYGPQALTAVNAQIREIPANVEQIAIAFFEILVDASVKAIEKHGGEGK